MLPDHPNPNQNYAKIQNFESGLMAMEVYFVYKIIKPVVWSYPQAM